MADGGAISFDPSADTENLGVTGVLILDQVKALAVYSNWIRDETKLLRELLELLPQRHGLDRVRRDSPDFDELRSSRLIDIEMLNSLEDRMARLGNRRRLPGAIGAAKELTEAVIRVAIERIAGAPPSKKTDLPGLNKQLTALLRADHRATPTEQNFESLARFLATLSGSIAFLAEWRNELGEGHGRRSIPAGLRMRHAALAVDAATTYTRFVVLTLDDLNLLPARSHGT